MALSAPTSMVAGVTSGGICISRLTLLPLNPNPLAEEPYRRTSHSEEDNRNIKDYFYLHLVHPSCKTAQNLVHIETLHVTYYPVNMADCSNSFKRSVITTYHHSLFYSVANALVSNQSITAFC